MSARTSEYVSVASRDRTLRRLERLARLLDSEFRVPGIRFRFGLDGLIGLAPGVGDAVGLALSSYIVMEAWRMGVPPQVLVRMIANILIDSAVGAVPVAGDLFDFVWKANRRNIDLLLRHGRGTRF